MKHTLLIWRDRRYGVTTAPAILCDDNLYMKCEKWQSNFDLILANAKNSRKNNVSMFSESCIQRLTSDKDPYRKTMDVEQKQG
jgi:hypothetical protein